VCNDLVVFRSQPNGWQLRALPALATATQAMFGDLGSCAGKSSAGARYHILVCAFACGLSAYELR
jgi:hypothetical protein